MEMDMSDKRDEQSIALLEAQGIVQLARYYIEAQYFIENLVSTRKGSEARRESGLHFPNAIEAPTAIGAAIFLAEDKIRDAKEFIDSIPMTTLRAAA